MPRDESFRLLYRTCWLLSMPYVPYVYTLALEYAVPSMHYVSTYWLLSMPYECLLLNGGIEIARGVRSEPPAHLIWNFSTFN